MYELVAFIEFVGRLPSKDSNTVRAHYISYRLIRHMWIRNDDERCHRTRVHGDYKVNMAFFRRIASTTVDELVIEDEGILEWRKSVVIRGVFNPRARGARPRGRGRGRGHGRGRGRSPGSKSVSGNGPNDADDSTDVQNPPTTDEPQPGTSQEDGAASAAGRNDFVTDDDIYMLGDSSSSEESGEGTVYALNSLKL